MLLADQRDVGEELGVCKILLQHKVAWVFEICWPHRNCCGSQKNLHEVVECGDDVSKFIEI